MKKNKKNIRKKLNISLFTIFILFQYIFNCNAFCTNNKNNSNDPTEKYSLYQKCNKSYCNFIKKFLEDSPTNKNKKKYLFTDQYSLSKIQISNNFINFKNIYLKDCNQSIFHQLGYQFINQKKIYNFGLGYRNYYHNQWIIGNNIFYDTLLSSPEKDKKILSVGTELLKNSIQITINTYYNISNHNLLFIKHKKYLPFSYDVYIKNRLPFFTNTYAKINMEHFFNKHNKKTISINTEDIIKQYPFNKNAYKLTLGLVYSPISIFTFNVDKVISNSIRNHETNFNIVANYKICIPWIQSQKKEKINNNQGYMNTSNYEKIRVINNDEYTTYRNHTMLLLYPLNININNIKTSTENNTNVHDSQNKNDITPNTTTTLHDIKKKLSNSNNDKTSSLNTEPFATSSEFNEQIQVVSTDNKINTTSMQNTSTVLMNVNDNKLPPDNLLINETHHTNQMPLLSEIDDAGENSVQKNSLQTEKILEKHQKKSQKTDISLNNIPPPPPIIFEIFSNNNNVHSKNNVNPDDNSNNHKHHLYDLKDNIVIINKHKTEKFSSLGSKEHLLKLNNITIEKRKKTISTSSNDSNDSESIRLLRIIERQSALIKNNDDSDNEDNNSILSDNDFSE